MGKTLVFTDLKVFSVPLCLRGEVLVCERAPGDRSSKLNLGHYPFGGT